MSPHGVAGHVAENAPSTSTARATPDDNTGRRMVPGYLLAFATPLITTGSPGHRSGCKAMATSRSSRRA